MRKLKKISEDHPFLILFIFVVIAYLPVLLPFFHLKNDLITQNLPTRYFISESLYSEYFPWWNPYIHFGIPQYGDMNNGFWNPFLWITAKTFGYNIWTITFEEMFYILIGGWGIYKVLRELNILKGVAILVALSYMSCGYIVGHLQHFNWITGTAFFPYACLYFLKINKNPVLKNFIIGSVTVFLFVSSTHPGFIIGAGYFFIFSLLFLFIFRKTYCRDLYQSKFWLINFTFFLLSGVFSIVVIISNLDVLQHISRGNKISLPESLLAPTSFQSYLSFLFPLAVNKSSFFATDISMRNIYAGLSSVAGIIFLSKYINKKILVFALIPLLFFVLLSSGGIFKTIFYHILPLVGHVRLNGEFVFFVIVIILLLVAFSLQFFITNKNYKPLLIKSRRFLIILFSSTAILALFFLLWSHSSIVYGKIFLPDLKVSIKNILDNLQFTDLLLINALIQLFSILLVTRKYSHSKAIIILACNLIVITWLTLPFTGLGMAGKKEMNKKMMVLPHGLYAQELLPLNQLKFLDSSLKKELLLLGSYTKKIGYPLEEQYPVQLNTTKKFFEDTGLHNFINKQAFIFLSEDTTIDAKTSCDSSLVVINAFGPGHLKITVNNTGYHFLIFLQNNYPYWEVFIDGKKESRFTAYKTFVCLSLKQGVQKIEFRFNPVLIRKAMKINIAILMAGFIILLIPRLGGRRLFS
jgi:hypothetical protein